MRREPSKWLSPEMRETIRDAFLYNHGIVPDDDDINWISAAEENRAHTQYYSRTLRRLETRLVRRSQTTDHIHRASDLLTEASGCYCDGRFEACILVSRAAVEAALHTAVGQKGSLHKLVALAQENGLLDEHSCRMADTLRNIGNEFAHNDSQAIVNRDEVKLAPVVFVGDLPDEADTPVIETNIRVSSAASRLSFTAYEYAVRICEKLIPPRNRRVSQSG